MPFQERVFSIIEHIWVFSQKLIEFENFSDWTCWCQSKIISQENEEKIIFPIQSHVSPYQSKPLDWDSPQSGYRVEQDIGIAPHSKRAPEQPVKWIVGRTRKAGWLLVGYPTIYVVLLFIYTDTGMHAVQIWKWEALNVRRQVNQGRHRL